jgi:PHP family Zn ribbon phosphoesterase
MTQGKCEKCKVRYTWFGEAKSAACRCVKCGGPLARTSYLSHLTTIQTTRKTVCLDWKRGGG